MVDDGIPAAVPSGLPARRLFPRFALLAGFTLAGLSVLWLIAGWTGFGRDIHWLRAVPAAVALAIAGLEGFNCHSTRTVRILAFGLGAFAAVGMWWGLPCRAGGPNLIAAANQHESLKRQMTNRGRDAVSSAPSLRQGIANLAADYPSLAADLASEVERWAEDVTAALVAYYDDLPIHDVRQALALQTRASLLLAEFPQCDPAITTALENWVDRSLSARLEELHQLPLQDWVGFERTAAGRRLLATSFPQCKTKLIETESQVIDKWVRQLATRTAEEGALSPNEHRKLCRATSNQLQVLKSLDPRPGRFREAQEILFRTAHHYAELEVRNYTAAQRYDLAFAVASGHWLEWLAIARQLGPRETKQLNELREMTRAAFLKHGESIPLAPPPRSRETAPPPRPTGTALGVA